MNQENRKEWTMEWTIDVIRPDEEGVRFYLQCWKPFRLMALQSSPEGKLLIPLVGLARFVGRIVLAMLNSPYSVQFDIHAMVDF
jgi:hypothetical protein